MKMSTADLLVCLKNMNMYRRRHILFHGMHGEKCTTDGKMNIEALVFILALASKNRCEFSVDHYLLTNELETNGILTTSADSTKHSALVAGDRRGVALTELGEMIANEVFALLDSWGLIGGYIEPNRPKENE